jgi:hypothetical protein
MDKVSGEHIGDGIYFDDLGDMIRTSTPRAFAVHEIFYGPTELWQFLLACIRTGWLNRKGLEELLSRCPEEEEENEA